MPKPPKKKPPFVLMPQAIHADLSGGEWYTKDGPAPFEMEAKNVVSGLHVLVSYAKRSDKKTWLHVSVQHASRPITMAELADVKRRFIGDDRKAIQVFPEKSKHVNLEEFCHHLFHCVDGDPLPEFSGVRYGVRTI